MYKFWFYLFWFLLSFSQLTLAYRGVGGVIASDWIENKQPTQHALVVGIDNYQSEDLMTLNGAVNDAKLLSSALRKAGVKLPNSRILLNEQATRVAFDGNKNGRLERDELDRFLTEKIQIQTNHNQTSKVLPRSDKVSVLINSAYSKH